MAIGIGLVRARTTPVERLVDLDEPAPGPAQPPRFSRTAIVGALWAPTFFIALVLWFWLSINVKVPVGTKPPEPAWWQYLLIFTLLPLGVTAPFGTTILGWVAVSQIRRSGGRLYGKWLALIDGLLFPVLLLVVAVIALFYFWLFQKRPTSPQRMPVSLSSSSEEPDQILERFDWEAVADSGRLQGGTVVTEGGDNVLKVENPNNQPMLLTLLTIPNRNITKTKYALTGTIRYENVQGTGYLEMWSHFSPSGQYFTRTLGAPGSGPMAAISGASGWRAFSLPFDRTGTTNALAKIEVNLYLPAQGVVYLRAVRLVQDGVPLLNVAAPTRYTQDQTLDIAADGTTRFRTTITEQNSSEKPRLIVSFVNSDFVNVLKMADSQRRAISFTTQHSAQTKMFRYHATLNEPVPPGAWHSYTSEGTMSGLVKSTTEPGVFEYRMRHWPAVTGDTRRLETYRLPAGAQVLSKEPGDLVERDTNGHVELHIDRLIPQGDSLEVIFTYRLSAGETKPEQENVTMKTTIQSLLATAVVGTVALAQETKETSMAMHPPVVVKTSPVALANDVDPSLDKITVIFDRPMMDGSWSWTGGGETYPEITGKISYDAGRMTCILPVKLQPGKVYWVGINSPSHRNFKSADRVPVQRHVILFATKSADGKPTPLPGDLVNRAKAINGIARPAGGAVAESPEAVAVDAAKKWLSLVDEGKYAESWTATAKYFQIAITREQWHQALQPVRGPLGKMLSRAVRSKTYQTSVPGAPDGEYVVIQFDTSFEHKKTAVETVTPMREQDGQWRVSGYYIK